MSLLKSDLNLFAENVYCFTPNGEVKNLPAGSTPIDFAYSIHSAVGNMMIGARVNGRLVPIEYEIKNGDRVEIMTSQNSKGPSRDWLNHVKSSQAKNKINQWFKNEFKEENIVKGRDVLNAYIKSRNIDANEILATKYREAIQHKYGFQSWEAVLAAMGHGALKEGQIINRMLEMYEADHPKQVSDEEILAGIRENEANRTPRMAKSKSGIVVKGIHDLAVRFSKCCAPVPGDEIMGFVTRGRGISIHRTDCVNMLALPETERNRIIEAEWEKGADTGENEKYVAEVRIIANNRPGLLAETTKALSEKNIDIQSMNTRNSKSGVATMNISFEITNKDELHRIIDKLGGLEGVISIERTTG